MPLLSNHRLRLAALSMVAGFLPVILPYFANLGGDVYYHYTLIRAFSEQFWNGDFFPRWCSSCDGGLGSPVFLFYFPLPYWISALFYPLRAAFNLPVETYYLLMAWLAGSVAFASCYCWLRLSVKSSLALAGAFLLLWAPYRVELLYQRSGFAELWAMGFLPLVFWGATHIARAEYRYVACIPLVMAAALLSHLPLALLGIAAGFAYVLLASRVNVKSLCIYAACAALALGLTAFYWLPAKAMLPFLGELRKIVTANVWVNNFIDAPRGGTYSLGNYLLPAATMLFLMLAAGRLLARWRRLHENAAGRECRAWFGVTLACFIFMFSITGPLWALLDPDKILTSPWRLQAIISCLIMYFLVLFYETLAEPKHFKTCRFDYLALLFLLFFFSGSRLMVRVEDTHETYERIIAARLIGFFEYQSRWVSDFDYDAVQRIVDDAHANLPRIRVSGGVANVNIERWDEKEIRFSLSLRAPAFVHLRHYYFPIWRATSNGFPIALSPEGEQGLMRLELPAGAHTVSIVRDAAAIMPPWARFIWVFSMLALVALAGIAAIQVRLRNRVKPPISSVT